MRRRKYKDEKGAKGPIEHKSPQISHLNHITPDQLNSVEIGKTPIDGQSAVLGTIEETKKSQHLLPQDNLLKQDMTKTQTLIQWRM